MKTISDKELDQIKEQARKLFQESNESIYRQIDRDKLLFQALNDWLVQNGIECDWRIK